MRTCTMMHYSDGFTTGYVVLRGPMRGLAFDSAKADVIAHGETITPLDYKKITAQHATKDAPAVYWQA